MSLDHRQKNRQPPISVLGSFARPQANGKLKNNRDKKCHFSNFRAEIKFQAEGKRSQATIFEQVYSIRNCSHYKGQSLINFNTKLEKFHNLSDTISARNLSVALNPIITLPHLFQDGERSGFLSIQHRELRLLRPKPIPQQ